MQAYITATGIGGLATSKNAITKAKTNLDSKFKDKAIAVYPFLGGTTGCKFNLYDPEDLDTAFRLVFTASPPQDAAGVTFNGTSQRADSFIVPVADGLYDDTGMCVAWYCGTSVVPANDRYIFGSWPIDVMTYSNPGSVNFASLGGTQVNMNTGSGLNMQGVWLLNRAPNSGTLRLLKNGTLVGSAANAFVNYSDQKFLLGAIFDVIGPPTNTYYYGAVNFGFMYIGKGLTTGQQETDMYNIINTFKTDMSR